MSEIKIERNPTEQRLDELGVRGFRPGIEARAVYLPSDPTLARITGTEYSLFGGAVVLLPVFLTLAGLVPLGLGVAQLGRQRQLILGGVLAEGLITRGAAQRAAGGRRRSTAAFYYDYQDAAGQLYMGLSRPRSPLAMSRRSRTRSWPGRRVA